MEELKKKSKYFGIAVSLILLAVIFFSYYNFFIKNEFQVIKQVPCDPQTEACFVSDCEVNDPECDTQTTYKKITAPSKYAGNDYKNFICNSDNPHCQIIFCSDDTVEAGEKCFK